MLLTGKVSALQDFPQTIALLKTSTGKGDEDATKVLEHFVDVSERCSCAPSIPETPLCQFLSTEHKQEQQSSVPKKDWGKQALLIN